jgi:polyhydroxyalkanoate synthesis regulator protein
VRVEDSRNVDITREVLLQVILESPGGPELLPVGLLRRIIRVTGDDPVQRWLRPSLQTATELLHDQLDQAEARLLAAWRGAAPPADKSAVPPSTAPPRPRSTPRATEPKPPPPAPIEAPPPGEDPELDELRARLAKLENRLKKR